MPHPHLAIEFAPDRVVAARWKGTSVDESTVETLPPAALVPSAVEPNVINASALKTALANIVSRLRARDQDVALILPDPVIRVFVQHFDEFPRSPQEAIPMLRWKLKKSIPFDADETVISYMRQPAHVEGVDIVTVLARLSGVALTTVVVRGGVLCGLRCTELPVHSGDTTPKRLLDEM